jgi:hypothetical protein
MIENEEKMTYTETQEREDLSIYIYDGFKDAYGVKGRHYKFETMSLQELRDEAAHIEREIVFAIDAEQEAATLAVEEFEHRVVETIRLGAGDRETALRWMTQGDTFYSYQDVEHWVWDQGILFTDYGRNLVKELEEIVTYC